MKGAIVALAMLSGVSHGFVAPNSASSPRAAKASAASAARNNYYNTLSQAEKLDQLARCRFMDRSEFDDGIAAIAGKKCVIIGCGAQGLNQGLNMRDSGCDVSYALRQVAIDEKRASYVNAQGNGFTVGRLHLGSADFSLSSYSLNDEPGDYAMEHFDASLARDEHYVLPLARKARAAAANNGGHGLRLFFSPWSPPA